MRKTSHDGIDATSITSGIENEIKKAGTNISKIKKSSIKRKVQNFSHETDEGIIEPLLQIEKEKSEIANRSAKYLLNKSKTDSSYERVNKSSDNFVLSANTISTPVSLINKIINKDNQFTISYTSGAATMHNHMNTNVFGTYDDSKGIIATKIPILVEIDGSKSGAYSPSPLIFTTAKIHTDSKSKLMEPVQTTPVPILSTIEGNVVKTLSNNSEQHIGSFTIKPIDQNTTKSGKSDTNELPSIKVKSLTSTKVIPVSSKEEIVNSMGVSYLNECKNKNLKESEITYSSKDSVGPYNKNQTTSQLSNISSKNITTITTNSVNFPTKIMKDEICTESSTIIKFNSDSVLITTKSSSEAIVSTNRMTSTEKSIPTDKNKSSVINNNDNKALKTNVQVPLDLQHMTDNKLKNFKPPNVTHSDIKNCVTTTSSNLENEEKMAQAKKITDSVLNDVKDTTKTIKVSVSSINKKLQRQKNASLEDTNDTTSISSPLTIEKSNITHESDKKSTLKNGKVATNKVDYKNGGTSSHEKFQSDTKSTTMVEKPPSTAKTTPLCKPIECIIPTTTTKIKSTTDVLNLKPATFSTFIDVSKTQPSMVCTASNTRDNMKSVTTSTSQPSSKVFSGSTSVMVTVSKPDSYNLVPKSTKADLSVTCESSVVTTTLPSYIVSTSKTKIGATLATSTLTSTTKSLTQKLFAEVIYTPNEKEKNDKAADKSDRSPFGTSSNSTKHPNFSQQTKSKTDSFAKDGGA